MRTQEIWLICKGESENLNEKARRGKYQKLWIMELHQVWNNSISESVWSKSSSPDQDPINNR